MPFMYTPVNVYIKHQGHLTHFKNRVSQLSSNKIESMEYS